VYRAQFVRGAHQSITDCDARERRDDVAGCFAITTSSHLYRGKLALLRFRGLLKSCAQHVIVLSCVLAHMLRGI